MPERPDTQIRFAASRGSNGDRPRDRRDRILEAALDAFGSQGFEFTSIEGLCVIAGVTTRHFDLEFDSRDAVLAELYKRCADTVRQRLVDFLESVPDDMDPHTLALATLTELLHTLLDDPRVGKVICVEPTGVGRRLERVASQGLDMFALVLEGQFDRMVRGGWLPDLDYRLQSIALAGAVYTLAFRELTWDEPPGIDRLIEELALIFSAYVEGVGPVVARRSEAEGKRRK